MGITGSFGGVRKEIIIITIILSFFLLGLEKKIMLIMIISVRNDLFPVSFLPTEQVGVGARLKK